MGRAFARTRVDGTNFEAFFCREWRCCRQCRYGCRVMVAEQLRRDPLALASSYEEWLDGATRHDARRGLLRWREEERSDLYDYRVIRRRYDELVETRESGDPEQLLYYLNEGLHGNMGGMGTPELYAKARSGTKDLVTRYIDEMVAALVDFEALDDSVVTAAAKRAYFERAAGCFGRSALMFSGAGSLGAFHIGVAKALAQQRLMPSVVSGASAGSVVAAVIGTRPPEALADYLDRDDALIRQFVVSGTQEDLRPRRTLQAEVFGLIESIVPDMTFLEAFEESGVAINVSVAPSRVHQRSRMLNAVTSPNAMIREAVLASCAVPGVFPPVTLAARDAQGQRRPYVPSRQWIDGSMSDDLPAKRLARMYGVNHFITSQTNPMVFWMLQDPQSQRTLFARMTSIYQSAAREWMRAVYPFVMETVRNVYPLNLYTRSLFGLMTQVYTADINILPRQRFFDPTRLLTPLSQAEAQRLIQEGERATWPKIEMIRNCTKVSRQIDGALQRMTP